LNGAVTRAIFLVNLPRQIDRAVRLRTPQIARGRTRAQFVNGSGAARIRAHWYPSPAACRLVAGANVSGSQCG